eukprot:scaffold40393_cov199-Amphora_coffeaeformis.AAC.2
MGETGGRGKGQYIHHPQSIRNEAAWYNFIKMGVYVWSQTRQPGMLLGTPLRAVIQRTRCRN